MKWFKHQSDMRYDTKIRRLISKFGVAGYGVYNFILEAITQRLDTDSPIPDLEDTSADVAEYLGMDTLKVEEIILFCMQQGLFEQSELTGRIVCPKLYKYIDKASTRSKEIRQMIENYNNTEQGLILSGTVSDKVDRIEQNRKEENRIDNTAESFTRFWKAYPRKEAKGNAEKAWKKIDISLLSVILEAIERQKACTQWQEANGKYIPLPASWLNARRWEDEIESPAALHESNDIPEGFKDWKENSK